MKSLSFSEKGDIPKEGLWKAVCFMVADCGTHRSDFYEGLHRRLTIGWKYKDEEGKVYTVSKTYNAVLSSRSTLYKDLRSWGVLSEREVNLESLVGMPALINVRHEPTADGIKVRVESVNPLPKGDKPPKIEGEGVFFDIDSADVESWRKLPEWVREFIRKSEEWKNDDTLQEIDDYISPEVQEIIDEVEDVFNPDEYEDLFSPTPEEVVAQGQRRVNALAKKLGIKDIGQLTRFVEKLVGRQRGAISDLVRFLGTDSNWKKVVDLLQREES